MSAHLPGHRPRLHFIVESGTDVRLAEGLAERFRLTLLARRIEGGVEVSQPVSKELRLLVGPSSRLSFAAGVVRHLIRERGEIDFVLIQGYALAALAANLAAAVAKLPRAALVCSPSERYYRCRKGRSYPGRRFRLREQTGLEMLARLNARLGRDCVALSQHLADVVRGHGAAEVEVIPVYGVDTGVFTPGPEDRADLRRRLGLPTEGALVFFSSRIAPEKDAEALLEAVRLLAGQGHRLWILNLSGGHEEFARAARAQGVAAQVISRQAVHPHRELPAYYQAADICVQASREEGLGFSPLEALACGVPVIASAVGGLRETIVAGLTGWTYPAGDAQALARSIAHVLLHPAEARNLAMNGRRLVRDRFERRLVFDALEEFVARRMAQGLPE